MTTQTATDELTAKAAAAWAMLTHAEEPMPPDVAVDFVQDVCGERDAAKAALYGAAAGSLPTPPVWNECEWFFRALRDGRLDDATLDIHGDLERGDAHAGIRWWYRNRPGLADWLAWCDRADAALALCRLIEAA